MKMLKVFYVVFMMGVIPVMARGAACNDDNPFYDPTYALCSVHSHNIGLVTTDGKNHPQNPLSSAQIQEMNEVIGLKTTILVQQLKAQYDSLAATVKRLQNQLHKAVLTSQMEMMTGNVASTAGSSYSGSNNTLAGATDCNSKSGVEVWECFSKNLSLVSQSLNSDRVAARKQLANDYKAIKIRSKFSIDTSFCKEDSKTKQLDTSDKDIADCIRHLQAKISDQIDKERRNERQSSSWWI